MEIIEQITFYGHVLNVYNSVDEPLFLAVEVARMIDYSVGNTSWMLENIDPEEKILLNVTVLRNANDQRNGRGGNKKPVWFLTEYGLYEVLMQSRKPIAKQFKIVVKSILRDMRCERDDPRMSNWFEHLDLQADFEANNCLREDHGLEPITFEEYKIKRMR